MSDNPPVSAKVRVQRDRDFAPHHILLGSANMALESAENKEPGWLYHELIAITFSALALEALTNAFGERLVERWKDFESASPIAKVRMLAQKLEIEVNFAEEPWSAVLWLVKFRNSVAHAKPEAVKFDEIMTREEFEARRREYPKSKFELGISTANARRAVNTVESILDSFCEKVPPEDLRGLICDSFSGTASSVQGEEETQR